VVAKIAPDSEPGDSWPPTHLSPMAREMELSLKGESCSHPVLGER